MLSFGTHVPRDSFDIIAKPTTKVNTYFQKNLNLFRVFETPPGVCNLVRHATAFSLYGSLPLRVCADFPVAVCSVCCAERKARIPRPPAFACGKNRLPQQREKRSRRRRTVPRLRLSVQYALRHLPQGVFRYAGVRRGWRARAGYRVCKMQPRFPIGFMRGR